MTSLFIAVIALLVVQTYFMVVNAITGIKVRQIAESTHTIVNNQRTMMLRLIAQLTGRIADENPSDEKAQDAHKMAERDADDADHPRRTPI